MLGVTGGVSATYLCGEVVYPPSSGRCFHMLFGTVWDSKGRGLLSYSNRGIGMVWVGRILRSSQCSPALGRDPFHSPGCSRARPGWPWARQGWAAPAASGG